MRAFCGWRAKFGGLQVNEAKRLRELEAENAKLKKLLAEAHLDNEALTSCVPVPVPLCSQLRDVEAIKIFR